MQELQDGQKSVVLGQAEKSENSAVTKPKSMDNVSPVKKIISLSLKYVVNKDVKIIKKDGTLEDYDINKVVVAVKKSAARMMVEFTNQEIEDICNYVEAKIDNGEDIEMGVSSLRVDSFTVPIVRTLVKAGQKNLTFAM